MLIQELGKLIREIAPLMSDRGEIEKCARLDSEAIGKMRDYWRTRRNSDNKSSIIKSP